MINQAYLIESLAPLVFRSGKPFGSVASAQDATFPLPSATAGMIRAMQIEQHAGQYQDYQGRLNHEDYQKILSIQSQGPFLVRFNPDHLDDYTILVPKPANALYFESREDKKTHLVRLAPNAFNSERCGSDLPTGLLPVQMQKNLKGKPQSGVTYWTLEHFLGWQQGQEFSFESIEATGLKTLAIDIRTHVKIDSTSASSEDGKLFQTASLDLNHQLQGQRIAGKKWDDERYGFVVFTEQQLTQDLATLGGERRLSYFKPVKSTQYLKPSDDLLEKINQNKGFSLSLLTPAVFENGYLPAWLDQNTLCGKLPQSDVEVKLESVAIDRWLPVSGWDSIVWKPKATRKAVGAGAVYWFSLMTQMDEETLQQLWAQPISDHSQDRNDGFGVAIVSAWSK